VPQLANKVPAYTRLAFTIEGQANLPAVVKAMEEFYRSERLHQIRNFRLRKPVTAGTPADAPAETPAPTGDAAAQAGPGGNRGPGGPGGTRGPGGPGGRGNTNQRGRDVLDVSMTVEVLIVNGAETRVARDDRWARDGKPLVGLDRPEQQRAMGPGGMGPGGMFPGGMRPGGADPRRGGAEEKKPDEAVIPDFEEQEEQPREADHASITVLAPGRDYDRMRERNMFTGVQRTRTTGEEPKITEDPRAVLACIRLVQIENRDPSTQPRRLTEEEEKALKRTLPSWIYRPRDYPWRVDFYDQAKGTYVLCTPDGEFFRGLQVLDKYKNPVLDAKVVDANLYGVVIEHKEKFYKVYLGEFLYDALNPEREGDKYKDPSRAPMTSYERGDWKGPFDPLPIKKDDKKKPEDKKTDEKKPQDKKTDEKKPEEKKSDEKKPEDKKSEEKKPEEKKPDEKKAEEKKEEGKKGK
jgi:hypothetical protein